MIPHVGIEADETLFVQGIYQPRAELYSIHMARHRIPIMLMSYVGALKSWIYVPILPLFGHGIRVLREPMLLAGVASVWLFYLLLRRIAGERAAIVGCALLAVDSMYLLTACFDWGPVALQHLLLLGGLLLLVRYYQERVLAHLAGGFLLLGLGLWDKALAIWMLTGLGIAALALYPRQMLGLISRRRLAIAAVSFCLGASPLMLYNARNHWATFAGNFQRDSAGIAGKAQFLVTMAGGEGLFGWLTAENWQTPQPHESARPMAKLAAHVSDAAGHPRRSLLLYAFLLALALAPLGGWKTVRAVLFAVIAMAVGWIQMAITANAGASAHHTVLLWPFPELAIAISWAAASRRAGRAGIPALAASVAVMLISGALVLNEYYVAMIRYGGAQAWNGAVYPLADYARRIPAKCFYSMDWGIQDQLRYLDGGKLPLEVGDEQMAKPVMDAADRQIVEGMIADPGNIFIAHTKAFEFFPGHSDKLVQFAAAEGYRRQDMATVQDGFGRPVFEIYRLVK